jgi:putative nucleotidyltransferase with HDIG domain
MKTVLFVDDDPALLEVTELLLSGMRDKWDMRFVQSGEQALKIFAEGSVDAVVSDMCMPRMSGAELLNEVMEKYPRTIRFVVSGYADMESVISCVGGTHQFLAKPCTGDVLQNALSRALDMENRVNSEQIQALVAQLKTVPSLPALYFDILKQLRSPDAPVERIGALISNDPAMTVKILHVVNSVFFGLGRQITDPTDAVIQLGLETVKSLVLSLHLFSQFESNPATKIEVEKLHHHSLATATTARQIARFAKRDARFSDTCFTAGLLHDIGRLILAANLSEKFAEATTRARENKELLAEAEQAVFGASHAEVGGYMLGLWGLPTPVVEASAFHHSPGASGNRDFSPLTVVHIADAFTHEGEKDADGIAARLDESYLTEVGIWSKLPEWRERLAETQEAAA